MKHIGIIGGGFTGTLTAVQLIQQTHVPFKITLIHEGEAMCKGIAYNPYSNKHLLNVIAGKMSAYPHAPDHFLDWVMQQPAFIDKDRTWIANAFLPRKLYGEYLNAIWQEAMRSASEKQITISVVSTSVSNIQVLDDVVRIQLESGNTIHVQYAVIATGNQLPRNPGIKNPTFYQSNHYYQNPWSVESVQQVRNDLPVLIVGNGLTMVDTVFGLLENGFKGEIYSLSPNGFNILPHRHNGLKYTKLTDEINDRMNLYALVQLVHRHIRTVREYGVSAEPVIDSLRPHTQKFWQQFSDQEKQTFMSRFRHLWGVARHRIPLHSHDKIQHLRITGKLHIQSGNLLDLRELQNGVQVSYFDKKKGEERTMLVSRVINCTGPESDLNRLNHHFLKHCLDQGIILQDALKLGIRTLVETFQVLDAKLVPHDRLFTLGSNLRGELWESTAVNELRSQAEKLAAELIQRSLKG